LVIAEQNEGKCQVVLFVASEVGLRTVEAPNGILLWVSSLSTMGCSLDAGKFEQEDDRWNG